MLTNFSNFRTIQSQLHRKKVIFVDLQDPAVIVERLNSIYNDALKRYTDRKQHTS